MITAPQHYYCPNCGRWMRDGRLNTTHVLSLMCSDFCRDEWQKKYASLILGRTYEEAKPE